jgi:hypothetical protein
MKAPVSHAVSSPIRPLAVAATDDGQCGGWPPPSGSGGAGLRRFEVAALAMGASSDGMAGGASWKGQGRQRAAAYRARPTVRTPPAQFGMPLEPVIPVTDA